jgi:hypothetical protein
MGNNTTKQANNANQTATVTAAQVLRARRVAAVQAALYARYHAAKQAKHAAAVAAYNEAQQKLANEQAFAAALAQLHAQFGIAVQPVAPRANSATTNPSAQAINVNGVLLKPVAAVHAICAANPNAARKQVIALCVQAGINPATAATQYNVYKQKHANGAQQ